MPVEQDTVEVNQSHVLVEEAFELAETKLEQGEITVEDMEDVYEALDEAYEHPDSDIWVTIVAVGPKNQCARHLPENDVEPHMSPRAQLEQIVGHEIEVTVS